MNRYAVIIFIASDQFDPYRLT